MLPETLVELVIILEVIVTEPVVAEAPLHRITGADSHPPTVCVIKIGLLLSKQPEPLLSEQVLLEQENPHEPFSWTLLVMEFVFKTPFW